MSVERVFHRIVVPTDFSPCAEEAWNLAQRLAKAVGAELVLTHALVETVFYGDEASNPGVQESARQWVEGALEEWAAKARSAGLHVRVALRVGVPHQEIVDLATDERADLVVMGTHGLGGVSRVLIGSVADRVVRTASCPVLTVREPR
jgi:nucleotide-binding universal stress UspA family protein